MSLPILKRNVAAQVFPFSVFKNGAIVTTVPLQVGDFVAFLDHVNMGNITVTEDPAASGILKAAPSQAMTDGQILAVRCKDQTAPSAWDDRVLIIPIDIITIGEALPASSYTAPPSAAAIDAQLTGSHGAGSWQSDGAAPTVVDIDNQLSATHGAGLWGGGAGTGLIPWEYTLTETVTLLPISGATVWATTDALGVNRVAQGVTDAFGVVTFFLNAGTYYYWRAKDGYEFTNPDIEVVA